MARYNNAMNILHVSPIQYSINDNLSQGGTERVVLNLNKELITKGVHSFVACAKGSHLANSHFLADPLSLKVGDAPATYFTNAKDYESYFKKVIRTAIQNKVDLVHDHTGWLVLSEAYKTYCNEITLPILTTLAPCYPSEKKAKHYAEIKEKKKLYFCVVSKSQKQEFEDHLHIEEVIYNGIDFSTIPHPETQPKKHYIFSLGRIAKWKGQEVAITIARRANKSLVVAGAIADDEYFKQLTREKGLINKSGNISDFIISDSCNGIYYIGKLNDCQKYKWFGMAYCFVVPILWDEPFGIVMIEAMACGTPVIAFNRGAAKEIICNGKTGYVVDTEDQMIEALNQINQIDPNYCRKWVEDNYSSQIMATRY